MRIEEQAYFQNNNGCAIMKLNNAILKQQLEHWSISGINQYALNIMTVKYSLEESMGGFQKLM
jgi:hypothetical protein